MLLRACATVRAIPGDRAGADPFGVGSAEIEMRRREIQEMLEEIRSPGPTATDIVRAVEDAGAEALGPEEIDRIKASILSLYVVR